jgi:hypothetical protein
MLSSRHWVLNNIEKVSPHPGWLFSFAISAFQLSLNSFGRYIILLGNDEWLLREH